jgi:hypothetical protein
MPTVLETLQRARELILDPEHWTKNAAAKDVNGKDLCISEVERGVCFCVVGALSYVSPHDPDAMYQTSLRAKRALELRLPGDFDCLEDFNDDEETTHAHVVALFDRAIAQPEAV